MNEDGSGILLYDIRLILPGTSILQRKPDIVRRLSQQFIN